MTQADVPGGWDTGLRVPVKDAEMMSHPGVNHGCIIFSLAPEHTSQNKTAQTQWTPIATGSRLY